MSDREQCGQPKSAYSAGSCPARLLHLDSFSSCLQKTECGSLFYLFSNTESAKGITESHRAISVSVLQNWCPPSPFEWQYSQVCH